MKLIQLIYHSLHKFNGKDKMCWRVVILEQYLVQKILSDTEDASKINAKHVGFFNQHSKMKKNELHTINFIVVIPGQKILRIKFQKVKSDRSMSYCD